MNVLLFGPPGSGKGTQARDLAAALGVPHVATGDIFRRNLKEGTQLGQLARSYMDKGALVPDSVTNDMVASRLGEPDAVSGALLDGFPRSVPQAEWLVKWLHERGAAIDVVLSLVVPDDLLISRIAGRRSCLKCGATTGPGLAACPQCGGELVQRPDDREEVVRARLETYARETAPVLGVLQHAAAVHEIDGVGEVEEVRQRVFDALALG